MRNFLLISLISAIKSNSEAENDGHNAVSAPSRGAIVLGRIFMDFSHSPNQIQLKMGLPGGLKPAANLHFSPKDSSIKLPASLQKNKFKDSVCENTQLDANDVCPDARYQRYPTADGQCNNRIDINRGKAFRPLKRLVPARYADGFQTVRNSISGKELPSARLVANMVQNENAKKSNVTHMFTQWGQYIIHDIVHTPVVVNDDGSDLDCNCDTPNVECINIEIPMHDKQYSENKTCFQLPRSIPTPDANCQLHQREQINQLSAFIDGTTVYGVDAATLADIRDPDSDAGELKTSTKYSGEFHGATLPQTDQAKNTKARCPMKLNRGKEACFFTGDKRVNENAGLACMHTLFLREHNRVARSLKEVNPEWSSDTIFNEAKLIIAAMHQVITYNEYLPLLLGPLYMKRYELNVVENGYYYGYDATIDASVSNSFTTAAFRFGHSMINDELSMPNADWSSSQEAIPMKDSLFNPDAYLNDTHSNVNPILRGLLVDMSLTTETTFPTSMKDFLFAEKDSFGKDLFAINVQRGREHGLGTYNDYREFFGMQRARSFAELKEIPVDMRARFAEIYDNVDDIDVYVGGLAEEHVPGGLVGPTFAHMMAKQFHDLKVGDRFYFEHGACETTFTPAQLDELRKFTLSSLICTCTDTESVQKFPFFETSEFNQRVKCEDVTKLNFEAWKESFIHTKDHTGFQDSGSWTEWIPPMSNPPTLELDVLKRERPDDLCLNSIASELRFINDNPQVRFICPAGQVTGTDFPSACLDRGVWTVWFDRSNPTGMEGSDDELLKHLHHERPGEICETPLYIQAQSVHEVAARETGDVFDIFDAKRGLLCNGKHQASGRCQDYRIRFFCPIHSLPEKRFLKPNLEEGIIEGLLEWTSWFSVDDPSSYGDIEYLESTREALPGICAIPFAMEAMTISDQVNALETGDVFKSFKADKGLVCLNTDQTDGQCEDYQVRYLCQKNSDFDYPEPGFVDFSTPIARATPKQQAQRLCDNHNVCCAENINILYNREF